MSIARARALIIVGAMLVFALAFAGWAIATKGGTLAEAQCRAASAPKDLPKPADVAVNVLNATDRDGLAGAVGKQLTSRGFQVKNIGTASDGVPVNGVGQVRFGPSGFGAAQVLQSQIIGLDPVMDQRQDSTVDVVLGAGYTRMATATEVAAAAKRLADNPPTLSCSDKKASGAVGP
ncbi:LytR C-terminal domain-containing protein [Fodinicola acaciae]|uniref:LytR C-terminal domain-containing protein n=1 Tax=Fodinicola acaciae TaxID=2681555 RepID=UPI0013D21C2D|nr:LytR C-terminal domain-containing protein [Fodinicola acaciae]